jgi:lipopolysaccharide export system permease protein
MQSSQYSPLSVVNRYLTGQFFAIFLPVTATFVLLYIVIDLFDRLHILLRHQATIDASVRYFLFKIPLMLTQITPAAVISSVLLTFGILSRRNEIVAFRASGISLGQTAIPIIAVSLLISIGALIWNETVVPYSSREFQYVNNIEIRKRELRGILSDREIWYHGAAGFYNIDYVDRARKTVYGLTIYNLDDTFDLRSVIEVRRARWTNGRWRTSGAVEHFMNDGKFSTVPLPTDALEIPETLDDFLEVQRKPEELSFSVLRRRIIELTRKGIDASHYLVDLHLKLALPFASMVLALVAIPIGGRLQRHPSIATIIGLGMAVGFGYWVILGFANSLGQTGAVPPVAAAWSANTVYTLLAAALFLYSD